MAASWECPSLPMIHLPIKDSSKVTFLAVKPMIAAHYEEDPESFHEEIRQLDQLRELALRPSRDYNGCSVLRRYFAQLHLLRARFPPETFGQLPIDFAWKDVYTNAEYIQEGLQIEQASVLYNICCLHSILASKGRRDTEQEMKEAITHFQCAAGAYAYLDERFATSHASKDLGPEFVAFYKNLMLGQAQECFVEKSLKGVGRVKNNTVAKLAARVSDYYNQCVRPLESDPCNIIAKKNKDWPKLLKMKTLYFQAISHFYQGAHSEEIGRHGEAIAWYQLAQQKLSSIGRVPKSLGEVPREAVKKFSAHVQEKLQTVKRQNDQVYHDIIPDVEILESTQGADLVKPVAFHATDPKNLGTDIFSRLVPMGAYEAASVFSEEKAKLLRSVVSSVTEKDEELEQYLISLNAGEIDKLHQDAPKIPDNVLEQHKLMQGKSLLVKKLNSDLQSLMELSGKVTRDLGDINDKKKEEIEGEEAFQAKFGTRTPSQVCAALWKEANNYQTYHNQASKSNIELKAMFDQHYQYLLLLSGPLASLQATVPKMTPMDAPEEDGSDSERWQELMGKVEKMRQQRRMLIGQLREQINSDDITKTMVGHLGSDKEVFISEHMRRHRELADIIRQNLAAQDNILMAVTDVNARQVRVRQAAQELTQQQERLFTALTKAAGFFSVLQSKIGEGLTFYTRLHDNISKLRKRVLEVVATRSREREAVQRQRSPSPGPGPAPPRPPKKAELAGKPLLPDQQTTPPDQMPNLMTQQDQGSLGGVQLPTAVSVAMTSPSPAVSIAMTSPPPQPSASSLEEQLRELQRTQQLQLQQLVSPSSDQGHLGSPSTEQGPSQPGGIPPPTHPAPTNQDVTTPASVMNTEMLAPDANQALLDLQMLLQPPGEEIAGLSEPMQPQRLDQPDGQENLIQPPPAPQRPVKPVHLQSQTVVSPSPPPQPALSVVTSLPTPPPSSAEMLPPTQLLPPTQDEPSTLAEQLPTSVAVLPGGSLQQLGGVAPQVATPINTSGLANTGTMVAQDQSVWPPLQGIGDGTQPHLVPQTQPYQPMVPYGGGEEQQPFVDKERLPPVQRDQPELLNFLANMNSVIQSPTSVEPALVPPPPGDDVAAASMIPPSPPGVVGSGTAAESTITTNSISRPIPAPVQSPPPVQSVPAPVQSPPPVQSIPAPVQSPPPVQSVPPTQPMHDQVQSPPPPMIDQIQPPVMAKQGDTTLPTSFTAPQLQQTVGFEPSAQQEVTQPTLENEVVQPSLQQEVPGPSLSSSLASMNLSVGEQEQAAHQTTLYPPHKDESLAQPPLSEVPHFDEATNTQSLSQSMIHQSHDMPHPPHSLTELGSGSLNLSLSHGINTNLQSLPQPPIMSSLAPLSSFNVPLSTSYSHDAIGHAHDASGPSVVAKLELLLEQQKESVDRKTREVEEGRAQIADQKRQLESYKQQVGLLHQQLSQLSAQQQKQEQEKVTVSGQQAVLMQLLQQQQGMFSQQQTQLESLSKVNEAHHKQLQESEMKYRQAIAVEQEQKANLQSQELQLNQEIQRLHNQIQSQSQQQQNTQMQVYQYHTQIQERDKQLLAFRDQHKQIVQKLEHKHQEKVQQLIQQIQELQTSLKKSREQQRALQGGLPMTLQPTRINQQQFQQPPQAHPSPQQPVPLQQLPQQPMPPQSLPQQPSSQQPQMSQGLQIQPVPSTPTSVPHQQGILQQSQPMVQQRPQAPSLANSAQQQPLPPTSSGWQGSGFFHSQAQIPQHQIQPSQPMTPNVVTPGNRPGMLQQPPRTQPGQINTGQGQFPPPTGVAGYPPQFPAGGQPQQQQIQRPPQPQFTSFSPGPQFPGQLPTQHPRQ